ncbi:hypothetical protein LCGC14_1690800 [marine sediment metagenome]|uniref:Uncharacterized protein n=1 Tax=marine sediment metagenome TaxID=412755 RepID=A0A0F9HKS3_9ZZZZ
MARRYVDRFRLAVGRAILWFVGLAYEEEVSHRSRGGRTPLQRDCERLFVDHASHP